MLKSKKNVLFIVLAVILLIFGIVLITGNNKSPKDKLLKMYNKISNAQDYTFIMEEKNEISKYKLSMIQKAEDYCIDTYLDDEHTTTLVQGNQIYFITHDSQEYYALEEDDENVDLESDVYVLENGLKEFSNSTYISGKEKIDGKEYYYEEFDNENLDFILFADINETSTVKTRFYFEKENIVYIKNIITNEDGESEEIIKVNLKYEADENLFKIPDDYAEAEY